MLLQKRKMSRGEVKWLAHSHPEASGKESMWEVGSCLSLISQCKSLFVLTGSNCIQFLWLVWLLYEVLFSAVGQLLYCVCRIDIYKFLATWRENCLFPPITTEYLWQDQCRGGSCCHPPPAWCMPQDFGIQGWCFISSHKDAAAWAVLSASLGQDQIEERSALTSQRKI